MSPLTTLPTTRQRRTSGARLAASATAIGAPTEHRPMKNTGAEWAVATTSARAVMTSTVQIKRRFSSKSRAAGCHRAVRHRVPNGLMIVTFFN